MGQRRRLREPSPGYVFEPRGYRALAMPDFYTDLLQGFPVVVVQEVAWGDMDSYAHVNNVIYFRYFENARLEYLRRIDWLTTRETSGVGPIVSATQARFRRALTYPDTIAIGARLVELLEDRFTIEHKIASRTLNDVSTIGQATVVSYEYRASRKVPIPEMVRRKLGDLEGRS